VGFQLVESRTEWQGKMAAMRTARFRHDDGGEASREIVAHPGSVAVAALDGDQLLLVRQPREAVGEQALLELPAGKHDHPSGERLATAKRELSEEVGKGARNWTLLTRFYASPGYVEEECHLFLATDLYDEHAESGEEERIEVVKVPLAQLDETIASCHDAKTLVGLLWLRVFLIG
jgi:ADP-ribose pyrophosphatase